MEDEMKKLIITAMLVLSLGASAAFAEQTKPTAPKPSTKAATSSTTGSTAKASSHHKRKMNHHKKTSSNTQTKGGTTKNR